MPLHERATRKTGGSSGILLTLSPLQFLSFEPRRPVRILSLLSRPLNPSPRVRFALASAAVVTGFPLVRKEANSQPASRTSCCRHSNGGIRRLSTDLLPCGAGAFQVMIRRVICCRTHCAWTRVAAPVRVCLGRRDAALYLSPR